MKRIVAMLAVLVCATTLAVAQQKVGVYTTLEEPLAKELFDQFQKETGIQVNWQRLAGGEAESRLEAEKANPQASIWVGGVGLNHMSAKIKGLTTPYKSKMLVNTPVQYRDTENYWVGLYLGPLSFITNNKIAKEQGIQPPKSWADLLKPEYKGKIRMPNPTTSGTAYNMVTTLRYVFNGDEDKVFDYLAKLDKNIDQYTKSGSAPGKSVAIGEIPIAVGYAHDQVKLKVEGADVTITMPSEGTGFEIASMSLVKGGPDPVNAKKLYDWVLSAEAQGIIAKWYVVPLSKLAKKNPVAFDINEVKTVKQDIVWDANNKERLLERWIKEIGSKR
ncbi:MAG: ABC transporter substrate-binding protein [Spirochaetaceae bacterium]|nr:ABC transporter substrate-binding protein [Spirochaetaceae bacterium]